MKLEVIILETASVRFDEIYRYTADLWGEEQAEKYLTGMFQAIEGLAGGTTRSRALPASIGVQGNFFRYQHHFVYWRPLENGHVGVVSILHERMHQQRWLTKEFGH